MSYRRPAVFIEDMFGEKVREKQSPQPIASIDGYLPRYRQPTSPKGIIDFLFIHRIPGWQNKKPFVAGLSPKHRAMFFDYFADQAAIKLGAKIKNPLPRPDFIPKDEQP